MPILSIISAALPILSKLLDLLTKTPEEKLGAIKDDIIKRIQDLSDGVDHAVRTKGDTSELERILNRK
jgi:hypothetical protein